MKRLMQKLRVRWLPLALMLWTCTTTFAVGFTANGINYDIISEEDKTCGLSEANCLIEGDDMHYWDYFYKGAQSLVAGAIKIPEEVNNYKVISVGKGSFYGNKNITSIELPESIIYIGDCAFAGCSKLSSLSLPNNVREIGAQAFSSCPSLTSLTIPGSVEKFYSGRYWYLGFIHCAAFAKCTLNPLIFEGIYTESPNPDLFYGLNENSIVLCPFQSLETLKSSGFEGVYPLSKYDFNISAHAFGCKIEVIDNPHYYDYLDCKDYCISVYDKQNLLVSEIKNVIPGINAITGLTPDTDYTVAIKYNKGNEEMEYTTSLHTTTVSITPKYDASYNSITLTGLEVEDEELLDVTEKGIVYGGKTYVFNGKDPITLESLKIGRGIPVSFYVKYNGGKDEFSQEISVYTNVLFSSEDYKVSFVHNSPPTKITCHMTFNSEVEKALKVTEKGFIYNGEKYGSVIPNLFPGESITVYSYFMYNDGKDEYRLSWAVKTEAYVPGRFNYTKPFDTVTSDSPTSVTLESNYGNMAGCGTKRSWWTVGNSSQEYECTGKSTLLTQLEPGTKNPVTFHFTYAPEGREAREYTLSGYVETASLDLKTLQPKCVSETCAIVAASTNLPDDEIGAGFQWKKYDAPASLAPSSASAVVCDGMLEGYIRNLQPTSYYLVRAFYTSASGNTWYGDWITFDPSDFSFFEPTVRTYPVQEVSARSAIVKGYALPGSEQILSQGFQYWNSDIPDHRKNISSASDIHTVKASGQMMIATLEDLEPDTRYTYRVFVETEQGMTFGDEQSFTTDKDLSGIGSIINETPEKTILGYYNLMGVRSDRPYRGLNIIVYSDGSSKKLLLRE